MNIAFLRRIGYGEDLRRRRGVVCAIGLEVGVDFSLHMGKENYCIAVSNYNVAYLGSSILLVCQRNS